MNGWGNSWGQQGPAQGQPQYNADGSVALPYEEGSPNGSAEVDAAAQQQAQQAQEGLAVVPQVTQPVVRHRPVTWLEWFGVGLVGIGLGLTARMFGAKGVVTAAVLYGLGYWVRGRRPATGWSYLPSPMFAMLPGQAAQHIIDADGA